MSDDTHTYEVSAQDVIDALIEQRNAALNELARATPRCGHCNASTPATAPRAPEPAP